ncbi:MAG: UDP-3-O-[3-hydroxymyristoyl] N-acetylglucosamine deacetylase, partial [Bdellovibrionales bacterium]|nr:UDP-3-O-[3-hydroxymyristoyl] N-acetylglucosamine deacetylase [Bdellovibrionales bacterium]
DRETVLKNLQRVVFEKELFAGRAVPQKTIARSSLVYGQGLHSGMKSGLMLEPLPAGSGIHFIGVSDQKPVPAHVDYVESTGFATTIRLDRTEAATIEHLLSALHVYGVTNLLVKCNGEVPVLDGSSLKFCELLDETGVVEQDAVVHAIRIESPIVVGKGPEQIRIEPADEFSIDYTLNYPPPLGKQHFTFTVNDIDAYRREIAPARTFGFVRDIGYLQAQGLAQGGRFDNFVLYGDQGPINGNLRFPNEAVRHKILDAIGDLYLLGRPLQGKVTASMTGHSDNIQLLRNLWQAMQASQRAA